MRFNNKRFATVEQDNSQIIFLKIRLDSKINIGKFSFINTGLFQKVQEIDLGEYFALDVPEWVTRNTLMFSSDVFNNSLYIQTGITFNYFTKFFADYYNPLLSEFVTQNFKEIGEYPRFDFFFNARIQQTRVFIKVEHLNSSFTGYDYYSDPFNPYRDMSVRLGLVWNFFSIKNEYLLCNWSHVRTSLDGLDIVYVKFTQDESWSFDIIYSKTYKYEDSVAKLLIDLSNKSLEEIKEIDIHHSYKLAEILSQFINQFSIDRIDFISSHGHTAIHDPLIRLLIKLEICQFFKKN